MTGPGDVRGVPQGSEDDRPETIDGLLRLNAARIPDLPATFHLDSSKTWVPTSWSAMWAEVRRVAAALSELGLQPGNRIAVQARTCREWQIVELAGLLAGCAVVGIDPQASAEQVSWILQRSDAVGLVADSPRTISVLSAGVLNRLRFVVLFGERTTAQALPTAVAWETIAAHNREWTSPSAATSSTPAMVIYTSGTTGTPKAIEYTHRHLLAGARGMSGHITDLRQANRFVCWLPMAALFQRMINLAALDSGSVTYFVEDPREIVTRIADIRPTVFFSVPRFYEKLHDGIHDRLHRQTGLQKRLVDAALAAGLEWSRAVRDHRQPPLMLRLRHAVLDRLVLQKIRAVMGGDIKWMMSGSAPAPAWLLEFFHSIGLLVLEAYGITENPVPIAANQPNAYRFGSVGRPLSANSIHFAADGEVLVNGPAMFSGYVDDRLPADRLTSDGYYRTGDFGHLDADGFLFLTGRVAEIIKTSTGRRISPAAVEGTYRRSRYIDQIVVVGNNRPHLVGLITVNPAALAELPQREGSRGAPASIPDLAPAALDAIARDLARVGESLARHEQVRSFAILPAPFTIENGDLTPTLKFRRDRIEARYGAAIERLCREGGIQVVPPEAAQSELEVAASKDAGH